MQQTYDLQHNTDNGRFYIKRFDGDQDKIGTILYTFDSKEEAMRSYEALHYFHNTRGGFEGRASGRKTTFDRTR